MISKNMESLVKGSSLIRAMFEEGKKMEEKFGKENVFDFSLGNPSVEPPEIISTSIRKILDTEPANFVHGYMENSGYKDIRKIVADSTNKEFSTNFTALNVVMTVGAAGALNIILKSILDPEDEVITFAPYFGEYNNYVANFNAKVVSVAADTETFQIDLASFEKKITNKTKAVIINSPNNPSGAVYSEETIKKLADILTAKEKEFKHSIYLIADEPYRKLIYGNIEVPYVTKYYKNTFVAYSFSKSLSLPGERIGYVIVPTEADYFEEIMSALNVSNRILGFVNSPSLMQRVVGFCIDARVDINIYKKNRDVLVENLRNFGYEMLNPDGAFYIFPKSLEKDDIAFCSKAKEYNLLIVPGSAFFCPGHFRIAYCTSYETVENSLVAFEKLAKNYKN